MVEEAERAAVEEPNAEEAEDAERTWDDGRGDEPEGPEEEGPLTGEHPE